MLPDIRDYDKLRAAFRWQIPERYNIGVDVCDRWAAHDASRLAILHVHQDGRIDEVTFGALKEMSDRLANVFRAAGIGPGDRIAILLPQMPEVAAAHIAAYKLGAVALPLAILFGAEALTYRLQNSGAKILITNTIGVERVAAIRNKLPALKAVFSVDGGNAQSLHDAIANASSDFTPVDTSKDDPALMIYTSGTTGMPKGALHAHRVLLGHLPGVEMPQDFLPQPGDRFWTPADWAWAGGLLDVMLPSLHHGVTVVSHRFERFDPEQAYALMARTGVRNAFIPPTALRMMRSIPLPSGRHDVRMRSIGSGGETLGAETLEWGRAAFGIQINEFYGQTECNLVLSSCGALDIVKPGSIGKPVPGHDVAVIRADGSRCDVGEVGQIAVRRGDPVMFLRYWDNPAGTEAKYSGDWLLTGDQGAIDDEGYFSFVGRDDDVITSAGYRIGPGEIEDCLIAHPAVSLAAAVGKPDPLRTEIVKAFIVLKPGHVASPELADDIQRYVRTRLSAHEYPREVEFVDQMPMTTTGKIIRRLLRDKI
ncbi:acetyl-coenzyme A synthetase [Variibacter gotjawalensis]|uniref:Acetyl-coenzyme A synthetase n=1 Tax=Variibacter gotjawalensis TaxID=1333996 RepID=A0A0S3PP37_9BRAD|nr:acyl-CoA synthetase [Variibacter gotjawalensis]NIK47944.1 acetyl-CoA synthetase [Variibacter gotjawalensis]RZS49822.1 acetyl-CoA synthetase [Variibacter gotjawalensis]BAT57651.1 acetyl-coenzyme A synthetase [Variibacter gotjawalensis]